MELLSLSVLDCSLIACSLSMLALYSLTKSLPTLSLFFEQPISS